MQRFRRRERIARQVRDELLQGIQGLLYRFQAASEQLPKGDPTRVLLDGTLEEADAMISAARESAPDGHAWSSADRSLEESLALFAARLVRNTGISFDAVVHGASRPLLPSAREELFQIGSEVLLNAVTHSLANRVELEVVYEPTEVLLRIRDDGAGFGVEGWNAGSRRGYLGLLALQERALRLHTRADIWSRLTAGTEVSVRVAGRTAYVGGGARGWRAWLGAGFAPLRGVE